MGRKGGGRDAKRVIAKRTTEAAAYRCKCHSSITPGQKQAGNWLASERTANRWSHMEIGDSG